MDIEEDKEETKQGSSLGAEERETVISWCDDDEDIVFIYTSQPPMIRRLLKNKFFELKEKHTSKDYRCYPSPIAIEGYLPRKMLTIRSKRIVGKKMTDEHRKSFQDGLKKYRKEKKK